MSTNIMKSKGKYFVVDSFQLAMALQYVSGQGFYKFDNEEHGKVYSFENTEKFQQARDDLWKLKVKYSN